MSDNLADDAMKILDNGWQIKLFKNVLGSYTAIAKRGEERVSTDDFTPSEALYRLAEKVSTGRIS